MTSLRLNQFHLARDADFRGVIEAATMSAASDVLNESPDAPNHTNRVALARTILAVNDPIRFEAIERLAWMAAVNPTIQSKVVIDGQIVIANVEDPDIEYVVASNWDQIAGNQ